ncbi:hypothetical protein BKA82DRAFT_1001949 [Pisolithus tinctorius]|uniref:RRM domain-containing protein n=1 Tax=Pisolithus tinctorius Marx 270 TaxID=870435 RepID=A0A0C3JZB1_PISTI|nr:hypothetical protein BKA82DRAFT_1001949 [Pisolithus tinctorius]KIO02737.1 hypothetical protein M404DRAFT_1001949 [Pisolithus tinctorius Marx 270]
MSEVKVSGIGKDTSELMLRDFFSFCGKITNIELKEDHQKSAIVTFERPSAAKTALMLDGGTLNGATLHVTSDAEHAEQAEPQEHPSPVRHIEQSDKPRAGIAAEYLAKGYQLSDHVLQRAIEIDNKQGISKKFLSYFNGLDTSIGQRALGPEQTISGKVQSTYYQARDRAMSIDEQKGLSKAAHEYYSKALASPVGQKVLSFYTNTSKQVFDIHEEARRIVGQHKSQRQETSSTAPSAGGSDAQAEPTTQAAPTVV